VGDRDDGLLEVGVGHPRRAPEGPRAGHVAPVGRGPTAVSGHDVTLFSHLGLGNASVRVRFQVPLGRETGICTSKIEPLPGALSNLTEPPWACTISRTIQSPSPSPP